jgi:hypothetical protein
VRTVLDVYGHLYEGADEAAAERLEIQISAHVPARMQLGEIHDLHYDAEHATRP